MKEEWLDKLRTRLHRECGEEAPRGLLDDIRKEMERRGAVPARPVRQEATTVPMWILRTASAAAVVAMVLYIGSRFGGQSPLPPQTARMEGGRTTDIQVRPMAHPDADRIAAPRTARLPWTVACRTAEDGTGCLPVCRTEGRKGRRSVVRVTFMQCKESRKPRPARTIAGLSFIRKRKNRSVWTVLSRENGIPEHGRRQGEVVIPGTAATAGERPVLWAKSVRRVSV